jgi:glycosyltransferase involved in cell wall biosynthesis
VTESDSISDLRPFVSVITPNFNRAHTIAETLESLQKQTCPLWECIVVDDGSIDASAEIVRSFEEADSRIHWVQRQREPAGACTCRNTGVDACAGDYVMFLDSDDIAATWCIEQRREAALEAPTADVIVFPARMFGHSVGDEDNLWNILTDEDELHRFLKLDSPWQGTGPLWKKAAFRALGGWNESLACWQDIDLSIRALSATIPHIYRYDLRPDVFLRRGDGNSVSSGNLRSAAKLRSKNDVFQTALNTAQRPGITETESRERRASTRVMALSVIMDHVLSNSFAAGTRILRQSVSDGVFTQTDAALVLLAMISNRRLLRRLAPIRSVGRRITARFEQPSTIGQIRIGS